MGLASACDICIASTGASFATSEVKFGIIPSAISPYVLRAIGARQAGRYFQTAERISAAQAKELGLAHDVVAPEALDAKVQEIVAALLVGGPKSQAAAKDLIRAVADRPVCDGVVEDTARPIAKLHARRPEFDGIHDEWLYSFDVALPEDFVPQNQDGEVAEFMIMDREELTERVLAGEFTGDAGAITADWLLRTERNRVSQIMASALRSTLLASSETAGAIWAKCSFWVSCNDSWIAFRVVFTSSMMGAEYSSSGSRRLWPVFASTMGSCR